MSLISLGLLIAARSESEEFTGGMLNVASWPMMMLSGVWFSLEGSPEFIQTLAQLYSPYAYVRSCKGYHVRRSIFMAS